MYQDLFGIHRMKINLHMHTTCSDGDMTPVDAARTYKERGYDAIAITDHWEYGEAGYLSGLRILSGIEYNLGVADGSEGVYHIVALGCHTRPDLSRGNLTPQDVIDEIHRHKGLAVLAHPSWSLNTAADIARFHGFDATEIYNTVSDAHHSNRPYSGDFVDTALCRGMVFPLLAVDDTHYYDGTDETTSFIMLACPENASDDDILEAIRQKRFYASQGPEIHIRQEGKDIVVNCSPADRICFFSNATFAAGHSQRGKDMTEARYTASDFEQYVRAEVTASDGKKAWSNIIQIQR